MLRNKKIVIVSYLLLLLMFSCFVSFNYNYNETMIQLKQCKDSIHIKNFIKLGDICYRNTIDHNPYAPRQEISDMKKCLRYLSSYAVTCPNSNNADVLSANNKSVKPIDLFRAVLNLDK